MDKALLEEVRRGIDGLPGRPNVVHLCPDDVSRQAEGFGTRTALGNYNYVSTVKNLSTALTVYLGSEKVEAGVYTQKKRDIRKGAAETIRCVHRYLQNAPLVRVDCTMGDQTDHTHRCALYVSTYRKDSVRLAHMAASMLFPATGEQAPDLAVVAIPEWQEKERQVLVFPEIGVTFILGTDYYGEVKNAFLRMAMWQAKQEGMLGLHAGTKILRARNSDGALRRVGIIMFGITATGKTTHSCHSHDLNQPGEGVEIVQDDVVFWRGDGSALGSERAFYIKLDGLTREDQPLLYGAATGQDAILENAVVGYDGSVDFADHTLTANGHVLAQRTGIGQYASPSVNLPPLDELDGLILAFMVRSYTAVPVVSKLTPEQAAVAFMLSESIDAAGSDQQPATGGIGSSPLVVGSAANECNIFYELLKGHGKKVECYMLNTGGVGEIVEHGMDGARHMRQKVTRVLIPEMSSVIRSIARGAIGWREDPSWMVETPDYVDGLDIGRFDLSKHYDQPKIDALVASIRLERADYAAQFKGLEPAIRKAVEF